MRKIYLFLFLLMTNTSFSQLLTFDFDDIDGDEATVGSNFNSTGVQPATISRGPGVTATSNGDRFNSNGWTTANTIDLNDYVQFIITPVSGFTLTLTSIDVLHQRSGTGPTSFTIRTSLDNYASNATNTISIMDVTTTQASTFTFNSPINVSSAVTIRIYAYSAESGGGTWGPGDGSGNDIIVNGSNAGANPLPNPGEIIINQVSPDFGAGSDNEYIELVNRTTKTFNLSGLAIRYQSFNGNPGSGVGGNLSGTLLPKRFWLLSTVATVTVGQTNSLARDGIINPGLGHPNGQIALVRTSDGAIIDAVGWGNITGGNYTENSPAPTPPTDGGLRRRFDGVDTDNNAADLITVTNANILLRNSSNVMLPVRFSPLRATQKGQAIVLDWSNATEENVLNYTIERSANGRDFTQIGLLNARNNNNDNAAYNFIDQAPLSGDNFYRIKATETTNKMVYTNVVCINTVKKGVGLVVYPNPVKGSLLNLQLSNLPAGKYSINIYAANGQLVDSRQLTHPGGNVSQSMAVQQLKTGLYSLQIKGVVSLQQLFFAE